MGERAPMSLVGAQGHKEGVSLAFGTKVVVPLEMRMPSYRVDHYYPKINEDMAKISLDLLEEKRNIACIKLWHTKKGSPDN